MVKIKRSYVHRNLTHAHPVRGVNKTNNKFYGSRYPGTFVKNAVGKDIYHYTKMPDWMKRNKTPLLRGGNMRSKDPKFIQKFKLDTANAVLQPVRTWLNRYVVARKYIRKMKKNVSKNKFRSEL